MRVYLDVSCLNRPFDDQGQARIRLEAEAVILILEHFETGEWTQVSSEIALIEINAIPDADRRSRVQLLLPEGKDVLKLTAPTFGRAEELGQLGFKPADALHVAAAEETKADVFLSCDDRLCRIARRNESVVKVQVNNPLTWLKEQDDAENP